MDDLARIIDMTGKRQESDLASLKAKLARNKDGDILATVNNAMLILAGDPKLRGLLGYDEFRSIHLLMRAPPPLEDGGALLPGPYPRPGNLEDVVLIQGYLQRFYSNKFTRMTVEDAVLAEASRNRFHQLREWLDGLRHDGVPRLDSWLRKAYGAPDDDFHASMGAKLLIASVRRIRQPGCKFDYMPILEGQQGIRKSTSIKVLYGEPYFSDSLPAKLEDKDAAMALLGVWVLELAEIEQVIRAEVEVVKAFVSRAVDRYRPPYGKAYIERPRQGILIGTTNSYDYLRDASGNRRFWPIRCLFCDVEWIIENREQLWAEAAARERAGESIWLEDSEVQAAASSAQDLRMEEDVWTGQVERWLGSNNRTEVSAAQILTDSLAIPLGQQDQRLKRRVTAILKRLGWEQGSLARDGESRVRMWSRGVT